MRESSSLKVGEDIDNDEDEAAPIMGVNTSPSR